MEFGVAFWALLAVSVTAAAVYGFYFERRPESLLRGAVKTLFLAALGFAFVTVNAPFPLILALFAAAIGDGLLAFNKSWTLPLGMVAFLIMQFLYIAIFFALWMMSGDGAPIWPRYVLMGATLLIVLGFLVWLWRDVARPISAIGAILGAFVVGCALLVVATASYAATIDPNVLDPQVNWWGVLLVFVIAFFLMWRRRDLGAVKLAAMVYAAVITQMALASFWLPWLAWPAMLGALSFIVSDGVLSAELFKLAPDAPVRRITGPIVWWTYAGAQLLIVLGIMLAARAMV